jgi:hypothetical protein
MHRSSSWGAPRRWALTLRLFEVGGCAALALPAGVSVRFTALPPVTAAW